MGQTKSVSLPSHGRRVPGNRVFHMASVRGQNFDSMKISYSELLQDPQWQKKRLEILQSRGWACEKCDDTERTLNVHHRYYVKNREPWKYPDFCYQVLCRDCHNARHEATEPNDFEEWELIADALLSARHKSSGLWDICAEIENLRAEFDATHQDCIDLMLLSLRERFEYLGKR